MDKLRGVDSLPVVLHRFSDGVEVVRCVMDFCNEVANVERAYSESLHKLLRSSSYTFHSNVLMQWLGSGPYEEIGSLKHSWQELGSELHKLADIHSEQAETYTNNVRKPLMELLPQLEEARKNLKVRMLQMRSALELAHKKMTKDRQKYFQLGDICVKLRGQVRSLQQNGTGPRYKLRWIEKRLEATVQQFRDQEQSYQNSHAQCLEAQKTFDAELLELYQGHQEKELERVNTLKESLQQFAKVFSNTGPAYLEGMQRIVLSVEKIDGASDIDSFVSEHQQLLTTPTPPQLEKHDFDRDDPGEMRERETGRQSPIGSTGEEEERGKKDKDAAEEYSGSEEGRKRGPREEVPGAVAYPAVVSSPTQDGPPVHKPDKPEKPVRISPLQGGEGKGGGGEGGRGEGGGGGGERGGRREVGERGGGGGARGGEGERKREKEKESLTRKREQASPLPKPRGKPHPSHVASMIQRMQAPRDSTRDRDGQDRERNPQPTPSSGDRGRDKDVHPASPTSRSTVASRPAPALKPKPPNLRPRLNGNSDSGTRGRHVDSHGSLPRDSGKSGSQVSSNGRKGGVREGERAGVRSRSDSAGGRRGDGDSSPSLRHPGVKPNTSKQQTSAQHQLSSTAAAGTSTDLVGRLPQLPVFPSDEEKKHSRQPGRRIDAANKPSPQGSPDLSQTSDPVIWKMLNELQQQAAGSDYYRLLGVRSDASEEELARARREKSRQLHPDHYSNDPEKQQKTQQQLVLINQVYQDVLKGPDTRSLYDQLCRFRQNYVRIPSQKQRGLETAQTNLQKLHKQMKRSQFPLSVLNELQLALKLIATCLEKVT